MAGFNGSTLGLTSGPVPGCNPGGPMVNLGVMVAVRFDHDGSIDRMPACALSPAVDWDVSATKKWLGRVH